MDIDVLHNKDAFTRKLRQACSEVAAEIERTLTKLTADEQKLHGRARRLRERRIRRLQNGIIKLREIAAGNEKWQELLDTIYGETCYRVVMYIPDRVVRYSSGYCGFYIGCYTEGWKIYRNGHWEYGSMDGVTRGYDLTEPITVCPVI